ncbi:hypothetical protein [Psychromonas hadalis]|uniref:hypothetical protein n=1 Tax=Psychromonas hadalis TaxID=211669 RepID=UPI0003B7B671|nr:hypothetical protein [Psychromonas hadalis]
MCNIHAIEIIPSQAAIDSIAIYRAEFDNESFDYQELLGKLKNVIHELGFMKKHDNAQWMQQRGGDYLTNPKLFCNAPLTHLCAFLGELFNKYELDELQEKLAPHILKCALTRLEQFH